MFFALLLRVFFLNVYHVSNTNKVSLYHTQSAAEWEVCAPRLKFKLLREKRRKEREREKREREKRLLFVTQKRVFFLQYDAKVKSRIFQKEREKKKEKAEKREKKRKIL